MTDSSDLPSVVERFLRYVRIDTQSDRDSKTTPSTERQKDLSRLLAEELRGLGLADAEMDDYGYVYATLPSTLPEDEAAPTPVLALLAHVDTCAGRAGRAGRAADPPRLRRLGDHPARRSVGDARPGAQPGAARARRPRPHHLGRHDAAGQRRQGRAARSSCSWSRTCWPSRRRRGRRCASASRWTRRSAAASTSWTSSGSAPTSPTPSTARAPARCRTRPSTPPRR